MHLLLSCLLMAAVCPVHGANDCGVSPWDWREFRDHLSWSKAWREEDYVQGARPEVEYTKHEDTVFWYLRPAKLLMAYSRGERRWISIRTCKEEPWVKCLKLETGPRWPEDATDILLGRAGKREAAVVPPICRRELSRSQIGEWRPSPDSAQKRAVIVAVDEAVANHSQHFGSLKSATIQDINLLDPMVFAVVEVEDSSGARKRVLMFVEVHSRTDGFAAAVFRTEEESDDESLVDNRRLIQKVLRGGIRSR